jgi:hypothetical protein
VYQTFSFLQYHLSVRILTENPNRDIENNQSTLNFLIFLSRVKSKFYKKFQGIKVISPILLFDLTSNSNGEVTLQKTKSLIN